MAMETKDVVEKLKYCIELLEKGYLTTPAYYIKCLALEFDKEGLAIPIASTNKEMGYPSPSLK